MNGWLALPIALPLATAACLMFVRHTSARRALSLGSSGVVVVFAAALIARTAEGEVLATRIGGWPAALSIPLVADPLAALLVGISSVVILVCTWFAIERRDDLVGPFHPLVQLMSAGIFGAFLTGDLFNLFVSFEVMLIASYVLMAYGGGRQRLRGAVVYVIVNLVASTILLFAIALTYGIAGTVNIAALASVPAADLAIPGALAIVAFGVKAAVVPVHGWLPRSYPAASPAVAALFSGLLTKVGVYAMFRVVTVVLDADGMFRGPLLIVASVTMLVGVLGAVGRNDLRSILSFHIVSQVGFMVLGLALLGPLGVAAGIFYIVHHIVVKTALFLCAGAIETWEGTGELSELGGWWRRDRALSAAFFVAALSLAGIPPLSGFVAKLGLIVGAIDGGYGAVAGVALVAGLLTLVSMVKLWNGAFWGDAPARRSPTIERDLLPVAGGSTDAAARRRLRMPAVTMAAISLGVAMGASALFGVAQEAADVLLDPTRYVEAVLGQ